MGLGFWSWYKRQAESCSFRSPQGRSFDVCVGFPVVLEEPACQCRRCKRRRCHPWVGKISWRRAWQPAPVLFLGVPWTMEPGGLQSMGSQSQTRLKWHALLAVWQDSPDTGVRVAAPECRCSGQTWETAHSPLSPAITVPSSDREEPGVGIFWSSWPQTYKH